MNALATPQTAVSTWNIDPVHTAAEFKVKHMMVSNVKGDFDKVTGTIDYDEANPDASKINITVDVASISTRCSALLSPPGSCRGCASTWNARPCSASPAKIAVPSSNAR